MQYRISAVAAIYGKALRLKNLSSSVGTIVNLAGNDCERFLVATAYGSYIIWGPLLTIAILVLGCIGIGWPFVAGFCLLLFVFIPVQLLLAKKIISLRSKIASITDERVALTSQATAGVRLMKIQGWEDNFESRISAIRAREIKQIQLVNWYRARNEALCYVGNFASAAVIFVAHVGSGGILSPRNVFPTFVLLNLAQIELTKVSVPYLICHVVCMLNESKFFFRLYRQAFGPGSDGKLSGLYMVCTSGALNLTMSSLRKCRE